MLGFCLQYWFGHELHTQPKQSCFSCKCHLIINNYLRTLIIWYNNTLGTFWWHGLCPGTRILICLLQLQFTLQAAEGMINYKWNFKKGDLIIFKSLRQTWAIDYLNRFIIGKYINLINTGLTKQNKTDKENWQIDQVASKTFGDLMI